MINHRVTENFTENTEKMRLSIEMGRKLITHISDLIYCRDAACYVLYHHAKGVDSFIAWGGNTPRIDDISNMHAVGVLPSHYWSHTFGVPSEKVIVAEVSDFQINLKRFKKQTFIFGHRRCLLQNEKLRKWASEWTPSACVIFYILFLGVYNPTLQSDNHFRGVCS